MFHFLFLFRQIKPYKTSDFRKFLIPDAFKHVRLQNTFNRCKFAQTLPPMVDNTCYLVKCINYQNVMSIKIIYFLQDHARFLQKNAFLERFKKHNSCKIFARKEKVLQDFCKNFARFTFKFTNLARYLFFTRILQKLYWLQEFCKIFAKIVFLVN